MHTAGCDSNKRVAFPHMGAVDNVALVHDPYGKSGDIIFILRVETGHLRRLSADEGRSTLHAAFRHTFYNAGNFLRRILAAGDIVQEE